jgi:hypothetical protein
MTTQLTEQEIKDLTSLRSKYAALSQQFGQIKFEQILLNNQLSALSELEASTTKDYLSLRDEEEYFAKQITEKYGEGEINLETGEFTASPGAVSEK